MKSTNNTEKYTDPTVDTTKIETPSGMENNNKIPPKNAKNANKYFAYFNLSSTILFHA